MFLGWPINLKIHSKLVISVTTYVKSIINGASGLPSEKKETAIFADKPFRNFQGIKIATMYEHVFL